MIVKLDVNSQSVILLGICLGVCLLGSIAVSSWMD